MPFLLCSLCTFADIAPYVGDTLSGAPCKGKSKGYGPFDYLQRYKLPKELALVESAHFTRGVEQLSSGSTSTKGPLGDLDYTLRAWPNHHRALYSAVRYRIANRTNTRLRLPAAECYLQRAINFSPDDGTPHMLYGILLQRTDNHKQALEEYRTALKLMPFDAQTKYNLSLLLADLRQFKEAQRYAVELYSRKYPLLGLKNKLKAAGHWDDETLQKAATVKPESDNSAVTESDSEEVPDSKE